MAGLFAVVSGVIADGARQKQFQQVHPALAHFTIVAPLLMFRAAAPVRARIRSMRHVDIPEADSAMLVRHLQMVARRMLARDPASLGTLESQGVGELEGQRESGSRRESESRRESGSRRESKSRREPKKRASGSQSKRDV